MPSLEKRVSAGCKERMREEDLERQSPTPRVTIRRSRAGRWRALALVLVHVLIAIHVAHWWSTGSTMTPLEPSESMEFAKHSVINAGLVFFALMIGSTLVFGRWFCGWACHIVALQDACRWLLMRVGIRPRMVNLGILGVVPWLAFVYMFLAPFVDRILHGDDLALRGVEMTRADFWGTFPPWPAAILTFAFCGFVIVYFLGSKAFCNYGCPYGAIFGIADQLAPIRIRVTDACEGCGHCTAVCSSNVRVHQEVRDYAMVVDPGCMKCLDCVSVCPKDALYVGAGTPAILARERAHASKPADEARAPSVDAALHWLLLLAFTFATLWEFEGFTGDFNVPLCAWLTGIAVAAAALFRGKARRKSEYTLVEEVLLAGFFLLALLAFRGWKGLVPFLFSLGLSAILAYLAVQALRLAYANNVGIQRWRLRASGHWTRGGVAFVAAMAPVGWVWFDAGWAHHRAAADREEARASFDAGVKSAMENRFDAAIASFERALALDPSYLEARENLAGMLCAAGRYKEGIAQYEQALAVHPGDADTHVLMARAFAEMHDLGQAQSHLERALELAPNRADVHMMLSQVCAARGDAHGAETHAARAKELDPSIAR